MSQAHAPQAPAPTWMGTLIHAIVGLLLFTGLAAGGVVYGFLVLLPQLLKGGQIQVIYERYRTLVPELSNSSMPPWLYLWAGAGVFCAVAGAVTLWVVPRVYERKVPWPWILGGVAVTLVLLVPPVLMAFLLPTVPRVTGGVLWWYITGAVLAVGLAYVGWMYFRDSRGVGPLWASLLGLVRASVLTLLAFLFMLPAIQPYQEVYTRSKVLILFDVSGSMVQHSDDAADETQPRTRQDLVLAFLADDRIDFLKHLQKTNPVDVFRFALQRDPEYLRFSKQNRNWTKAEFEAWQKSLGSDRTLKDPDLDPTAPPPGDLPPEFWTAWLKPGTDVRGSDLWKSDQKARFDRFLDLNRNLLEKDRDYLDKTNFIDSLQALLTAESTRTSKNAIEQLQGVVLFTDGHNTPGEVSSDAYDKVKELAQRNNVPIFVVGVGQERSRVKLDITELRVPELIQPDDKFPAVVEMTGEGLSGEPAPVELEVTYVVKAGDKEEDLVERLGQRGFQTGNVVKVTEGDKEELALPIRLCESVDVKPDQKLQWVSRDLQPGKEVTGNQKLPLVRGLCEVRKEKDGEKLILLRDLVVADLPPQITLRPAEPVKFDTGSPPRAEAEFPIDVAALAAAAGKDLTKAPFDKVRKWEIQETVADAEFRFRAHVPRSAKEPKELVAAKQPKEPVVAKETEHVSDPADLVVRERPLRVLLFASAATHEYQFVQAIMVRDQTKGRVKVSTFLQPPPGQKEVRQGVIQDAQLLDKFPDQFDAGSNKPDDKKKDAADNPNDLNDYDVILAFDPDWTQLTKKQIGLLFGSDETGDDGKPRHIPGWVDKGGGFVYVAGPVNTVQLVGPREDEKALFGPILDKLPVVPKDFRIVDEHEHRDTERAWPLDFSDATVELKFLKLQEQTPDDKFKDDWKDFFGAVQPDHSVTRGFYNFYPVESAKPGSLVAAYFGDPSAKAKDPKGAPSLMPYLVVSNPSDPDTRVIWLGSGEMWRLRQKNEAYLERFWADLTRYAADLHHGKLVRRITPNFGKVFKVGETINMEARIEGKADKQTGNTALPADAQPVVKITPPSIPALMTPDDINRLQELRKLAGASPDQQVRKAELERLRKQNQLTAEQAEELEKLKDLPGKLKADDKRELGMLERRELADKRLEREVKDLQKDMFMKAKPKSEGWYQVQFKAPAPGEYSLELTVKETGDTLTQKFTVQKFDPELDDTRPDFDRMYETASYADQYLPARLPADEYAELVKKLERPKQEGDKPEESRPSDGKPRLYFTLANADLIPQCMTNIEQTDKHPEEATTIWDKEVSAPVPVREHWMPWWLAWPLGVVLLGGCLVGSLSPLFQLERRGAQPAASAILRAMGGLMAWLLCGLAAVLIIAPVYAPPLFQLGLYAFTALVALMALEWLIRKLLRLA